ncbi:glutathione synthase [Saitoella complicata NRRL Y-17804]|uniref:Glutathione synthetase n=1 Tax=Saitoella complicata (strain BCRC 22490 / CBS 7301 / JCM 7358 / NBRC 10748 / NRRL Y-17804) TaxID=698492 RepID=A0A0E9NJN8_SAICN|nr:glutathione synthase [Saitoella complicata NRRL Y-17804]ODQ50112.1 glutathione synthase [Saitoella complicata NRRL Y-17804]GAO49891.1 hypothetical protein G7K_4028-t1 [Saitoella complicata NRRL Y-17804]
MAYPPSLTEAQKQYLHSSLTDYALAHGLVVRPADSLAPTNPSNTLATAAPVTLFPSLFPREAWMEARDVQEMYNELYVRVSRDEKWLGEVMESLKGVDEFMERLWAMHLKLRASGFAQSLSLGLFRSDYLLHQAEGDEEVSIKQVEFNTVSSSFGALSTRVSDLHRHLFSIGAFPSSPALNMDALPANPALDELAAGLAAAHEAYLAQQRKQKKNNVVILFVVQPGERNAFDQRWLEYTLLKTHSTPVLRHTLAELHSLAHISPSTSVLTIPHPSGTTVEVSTVYFRAGYAPTDFPTQTEWDAREMLERSMAIKCPTLITHLAGAKKVQQRLAEPNQLEYFFPSSYSNLISRLRRTFTALYPMDAHSQPGKLGRHLALQNPEKYVLKPQREGGGNNIYRTKIPTFLNSLPSDAHFDAYILMELIEPPAARNTIVRGGELLEGGVVGELGVYGVALWDAAENEGGLRVNREAGWLLRTKGVESEEGGVAAGYGCVDSVCLV